MARPRMSFDLLCWLMLFAPMDASRYHLDKVSSRPLQSRDQGDINMNISNASQAQSPEHGNGRFDLALREEKEKLEQSERSGCLKADDCVYLTRGSFGESINVLGESKTLVGDWVYKEHVEFGDDAIEIRQDTDAMYKAMDKMIRIFHDPKIPDPPRQCGSYRNCDPRRLGGWSIEIYKCDLAKYPDKDGLLSACKRKVKKTLLDCVVNPVAQGNTDRTECSANIKYHTSMVTSDRRTVFLALDLEGADFWDKKKENLRVRWFSTFSKGEKKGSENMEAFLMPFSVGWPAPYLPPIDYQ